MYIKKKNTETFYSELRNLIPDLKELEVWKEYDQEGVGFIGANILTNVAEKVILWTSKGELEFTYKLFDFFERSYNEFDNDANAYIYTDFHPAIINCRDSEVRDKIKSCMGSETMKLYNQLIELGLYSE